MSIAPVNKLLEAFEQLIIAAFPEGRVDINRVRSLSDDQAELPFFNVRLEADQPLSGGNTFDSLSAVLNISVEIFDKGVDSRELIARMVEYRSRLHAALMPIGALDLAFAREVGWLGANEPQMDATGKDVSAVITTRWQVAYSFNRDDPNDTAE